MYNLNNPRHKLNPQRLNELQRYFEEEGWKLDWLSAFFKIHRSSIIFHIRSNGWVRRVRVLRFMPKEITEIYRERKKKRNVRRVRLTYDLINEIAEQNKRDNCGHVRWIKRCSLCGEILGSDATHSH